MKVINIKTNQYFHMIPLWKSPIKLPVELPVGATRGAIRWIYLQLGIGLHIGPSKADRYLMLKRHGENYIVTYFGFIL